MNWGFIPQVTNPAFLIDSSHQFALLLRISGSVFLWEDSNVVHARVIIAAFQVCIAAAYEVDLTSQLSVTHLASLLLISKGKLQAIKIIPRSPLLSASNFCSQE